jgi:hypothetical protein
MTGLMIRHIHSPINLTGKGGGGKKVLPRGAASGRGLPRDFFSIFPIFADFSVIQRS